MGCCLSTRDHQDPDADSRGGAPPTSPPPVLEEETVKEVLLETPAVVPKGSMPPGNREWKVEVGLPQPETAVRGGRDLKGEAGDEEIVSEVSEMYSYSGSFSNATAAQEKKIDDGEDEDGVVNQRPPARTRRVPAGGRGRGRGRPGDRVVSRRAAVSPERRGQVAPVRMVRGRQAAGQPRNVAAEEYVRRREAGEDSRRRSKSPERRGDEKSAAAGGGRPRNDAVAAEEAESLENPVVSLECFIFL